MNPKNAISFANRLVGFKVPSNAEETFQNAFDEGKSPLHRFGGKREPSQAKSPAYYVSCQPGAPQTGQICQCHVFRSSRSTSKPKQTRQTVTTISRGPLLICGCFSSIKPGCLKQRNACSYLPIVHVPRAGSISFPFVSRVKKNSPLQHRFVHQICPLFLSLGSLSPDWLSLCLLAYNSI